MCTHNEGLQLGFPYTCDSYIVFFEHHLCRKLLHPIMKESVGETFIFRECNSLKCLFAQLSRSYVKQRWMCHHSDLHLRSLPRQIYIMRSHKHMHTQTRHHLHGCGDNEWQTHANLVTFYQQLAHLHTTWAALRHVLTRSNQMHCTSRLHIIPFQNDIICTVTWNKINAAG